MSESAPGLFVYGTLLPGECRHLFLQRAGMRESVPATAAGVLFDFGEYPGMLLTEGSGAVHGLLVRFSDPGHMYEELDGEEGVNEPGSFDPLFQRRLIKVQPVSDSNQHAWAYVLAAAPGPAVPRILSGDWKAHRAQSTGSSK